jgi:hypothetical protein
MSCYFQSNPSLILSGEFTDSVTSGDFIGGQTIKKKPLKLMTTHMALPFHAVSNTAEQAHVWIHSRTARTLEQSVHTESSLKIDEKLRKLCVNC